MRLFRRKPKFRHPCSFCEARGYEAPHRGQHQVAWVMPVDADRMPADTTHPVHWLKARPAR